MELIYALMTIIFAFLFILRQYQYSQLKKFNSKLEQELSEVRSQQKEQSFEVQLSNTELSQKPVDVLTGLPSREAFDDRLAQALLHSKRYNHPVALITLNVDHFHVINQVAYETGDELLKQLANRLRSGIRQVDTITRYAGNNFLILLPEVSKAETTADVIKRIQDSIIPPFKINDREFYITVSMGIAIAPTDGETPQMLLHHATMALQLAHAKGRNTYQFFRADIQRMSEKDTAITKYLQAPDLVNHLLVTYHPQILLNDGKVVHIHTAVYLDVPNYDIIAASKFMPLAAKVGIASQMIQWQLTDTLKQIESWRTQQAVQPTHIVLNVNMEQIEDNNLLTQIAGFLQNNNPLGMKLTLEVIEDFLVGNHTISEQTVALLKAHGIQLAFNFYTFGQFALQRITNLPIHYLKIHANKLEGYEDLMQFIIQALQTSDIELVVDGVDQEEQKRRLQKFGLNIMEGKLFDHLLPQTAVATDHM